MSNRSIARVGAPDPQLRTSPIVDPDEELFDGATGEYGEGGVCYFNGTTFLHGDLICSGSAELLRCESGAWVPEGGCDPDNP